MADLTKEDIFIRLETEVLKNLKDKKNFVIITIPGLGMSHELREIVKRNVEDGINYIHDVGSDLASYNLLDLNFDKNTGAIETVDEYFRKADSNQKFAVVINIPSIIGGNVYSQAFFSSRVYSQYYHRTMNQSETSIYARNLKEDLNDTEVETLYTMTGGIARFVKYLVLQDKIDSSRKNLISNPEFESVLLSVTNVVGKCNETVLEKLKVKGNGKYLSKILDTYFQKNPNEVIFGIEINDDLSFTEDGELASESLTSTEKQILSELVIKKTISRDKISEFKWGEGSYDEYSDQAINKTMQRLSKKLTKYTITPIPKVGYKIEKNSQ